MSRERDSVHIIVDFADTAEIDRWVTVNDNVMGGVSEGRASLAEDGNMLFSGSISFENNGGFASIRARLEDSDLGKYEGFRIRVKGDGRIYQFRVRVDGDSDGIAFKQDFATTADTWIDIDLPFAYFLPTYRGRNLQGVKPLNATDIGQIGFLIADRTAGPFSLIVDKITAYQLIAPVDM
ncbi:MAG: CIA30 family protein [candidate division Zixibacteria bacterium]|nr:CIA30 family protein [candidate division Zixibacteria bacterium]